VYCFGTAWEVTETPDEIQTLMNDMAPAKDGPNPGEFVNVAYVLAEAQFGAGDSYGNLQARLNNIRDSLFGLL
jgi:hypothetical protein